jgi:DNA-binding response OmpR family regulator
VKRILVVEDRFAVLEALRDLVEESGEPYRVSGVPSAEEGLLEMRRVHFDLLITDVRLPGMSGYELVGKVKDGEPDLPIIMITAYASEQGRKVAEELGVTTYLAKPVDADVMLEAIRAALAPAEPAPELTDKTALAQAAPARAKASGQTKPLKSRPDTSQVRERLNQLLRNADARQVLLISRTGEAVSSAGRPQGLNLPVLSQAVASVLEGTLRLGRQLGSRVPASVHYLSGQQFDLLCTNVGKDYCLAVVFDVDARRGRLGTVWLYARRAISELQELLEPAGPSAAVAADEPVPAKSGTSTGAAARKRAPIGHEEQQTRAGKKAHTSRRARDTVVPAPEPEVEERAKPDRELPGRAAPEAAAGEPEQEERPGGELDEFWEGALSEEMAHDLDLGAISFEEARKMGLIPPDFDPDDLPSGGQE